MDLVDDAEVSDPDPISFFDREHRASRRTGIVGQGYDRFQDSPVHLLVEGIEFLARFRLEINRVRHIFPRSRR